jgi:hypothetical protein
MTANVIMGVIVMLALFLMLMTGLEMVTRGDERATD